MVGHSGSLRVAVIEARGLKHANLGRELHPFVTVTLHGSRTEEVKKTMVHYKGGSNPHWQSCGQESFKFIIDDSHKTMTVKAMDSQESEEPRLLGSCVFELRPLLDRGKTDDWYPLRAFNEQSAGSLRVVIQFEPFNDASSRAGNSLYPALPEVSEPPRPTSASTPTFRAAGHALPIQQQQQQQHPPTGTSLYPAASMPTYPPIPAFSPTPALSAPPTLGVSAIGQSPPGAAGMMMMMPPSQSIRAPAGAPNSLQSQQQPQNVMRPPPAIPAMPAMPIPAPIAPHQQQPIAPTKISPPPAIPPFSALPAVSAPPVPATDNALANGARPGVMYSPESPFSAVPPAAAHVQATPVLPPERAGYPPAAAMNGMSGAHSAGITSALRPSGPIPPPYTPPVQSPAIPGGPSPNRSGNPNPVPVFHPIAPSAPPPPPFNPGAAQDHPQINRPSAPPAPFVPAPQLIPMGTAVTAAPPLGVAPVARSEYEIMPGEITAIGVCLGQGSFGAVYKARFNGAAVAVKQRLQHR